MPPQEANSLPKGGELSKAAVCVESCLGRSAVGLCWLGAPAVVRYVPVSPDHLLFVPTTARRSTATRADPTIATDLTTTSVRAVSAGEVILSPGGEAFVAYEFLTILLICEPVTIDSPLRTILLTLILRLSAAIGRDATCLRLATDLVPVIFDSSPALEASLPSRQSW
jgi:hypothetical protein